MAIRIFKIIVNDDSFTIVSITEEWDGYLFQYYDDGSPTHRLRESLEFQNMDEAVRFLYAENDCYDITEDFYDETDYQ